VADPRALDRGLCLLRIEPPRLGHARAGSSHPNDPTSRDRYDPVCPNTCCPAKSKIPEGGTRYPVKLDERSSRADLVSQGVEFSAILALGWPGGSLEEHRGLRQFAAVMQRTRLLDLYREY
jgi:hypothetical protein